MERTFIESMKSRIPFIKSHWEIDHLCDRTQTLDEYEKKKRHYEGLGNLLTEGIIGGRPIATYHLNNPVVTEHGYTYLLELPAPKPGKKTASGLEHIEVVVDEKFTDLIELAPELKWDMRALGKELNPEVEAQFCESNIKFHHHSLDCIINIEKHKKAFKFLSKLSLFKEFYPLVSGTIPLGIDVEGSDLDILMECRSFNHLASEIKQVFPQAIVKVEKKHLVARFNFEGLPIEIYAEDKCPLKQTAHKHLRIENRIIKLLGEEFKNKVIELKKKGVKTEPAFGILLELDEPYEDLLRWYDLSDFELLQKIKKV